MMKPPFFKRLVVRLLTTAPVVGLASAPSGFASVFMMHRLARPDLGVAGHDPDVLRQTLRWLRNHKYEILDLETLYRRLGGEGAPIRRAVSFTLDDGYLEQVETAAPIFAEFDAPSTTFLATGFIDRELWLWWDQVEYILNTTRLSRLEMTVGSQRFNLDLTTPVAKTHSGSQLAEACKRIPEVDKAGVIARLAAIAAVELPALPPARYQPITWDMAREAEKRGMRFGAQTVTHPILSMTDATQSRLEITRSWQRVKEEVKLPVPVFCYPNGTRSDFGVREIGVLKELGFIGAVASTAGYAEQNPTLDRERFELPRFAYGDSVVGNVQFMSGVERWKIGLRRMLGSEG
jgi:peptidoglycan/xylan/chitin deacetylase (PgdA/CDA1 family)